MKKTIRNTIAMIVLTLLTGQQANNINLQATLNVGVFAGGAGQSAPKPPHQ